MLYQLSYGPGGHAAGGLAHAARCVQTIGAGPPGVKLAGTRGARGVSHAPGRAPTCGGVIHEWDTGSIMVAMRIFGGVVVLAFYAAAGLALHLIVYGAVDWSGAFVYVAMAFWPVLLAWELLKVLAVVGVVVLAGLGLYLLARGGMKRLGRRI